MPIARAIVLRRLHCLILAGAVGGVAADWAQGRAAAADLISPRAADGRVRACTAQGPGFVFIPGTDTCLRVGGYLWVEGYYNTDTQYPPSYDKTYSISTGGLILDIRSATDYGTVRAYFETRFRWRTSDPWSDGPNMPTGSQPAQIDLRDAYVQFAGFTIGHGQSVFDFYGNANVLGTDPATIGDDTRLNLVSYTYEFSKNLSTSFSLEDAANRQSGILARNPILFGPYDFQAGLGAPDLVANLKYQASWGTLQLSGALHQVSATAVQTPAVTLGGGWGYALQAGVMFNLPALGEEDTLYLQSAYTSGATSYLGLQDPSGDYGVPDAFVGAGGNVTKVSGWNVTASLLHNWNERWSSALFGGYAAYDFNTTGIQAFYGASGGTNYNVGGYVAFAPVKQFTIALQYDYTYNSATSYRPTAFAPALPSVGAQQMLLFISRDF
ncbi:hypothetical protein GGQ86_001020 [Xanthobacter flavus]|uniref:Porin n=1 Tax=Xanthobacter flavus TaxID=281 RepID=A0A9W6FIY6_XANFL|nr:porin [Xanthobacter flavus]MDR6332573.1 hypothetical protein [Xanthobacter flavus]GLI21676.1 porin [Xanthobacter flavus]